MTTGPIEIEGIDLTLKMDITDRDIVPGEHVPEADMRKILAAFHERFAHIDPGTRFRWFTAARSHLVTFIPDEWAAATASRQGRAVRLEDGDVARATLARHPRPPDAIAEGSRDPEPVQALRARHLGDRRHRAAPDPHSLDRGNSSLEF